MSQKHLRDIFDVNMLRYQYGHAETPYISSAARIRSGRFNKEKRQAYYDQGEQKAAKSKR